MENSSVHSFRFVALEERKLNKFFFLMAFALSIYGFQSMASSSYKKYAHKVVSLSQDSQTMSVDQVSDCCLTAEQNNL